MEQKDFGLILDRTTTQSKLNAYTMHSHEEHELFFLISGQRRYFFGHTIYDVAPGNVIFVPRTMLHRTVSLGSKGFDRYVLTFSQEQYDAFVAMVGWDACSVLSDGACLQLSTEDARRVQKAFEKMQKELDEPSRWTQAAASQYFYEILLTCLRNGKRKEPCQEETADKIQQVAKYISEHYHEVITLEDAANVIHMEKTYFSKRFKALIGMGFSEFLTQTRLRAARQMLTTTDYTMEEISEACGFSGSNYFGDVFRRYCHVSPTEFRNQMHMQ